MADCERIHDGLLAEPVNALSSFAYVAAGVYVFRRHSRVHGTALVAVGAGSFAYHAVQGGVARVLHDGSIAVLAATLAAAAPRLRAGWNSRAVLARAGAGSFAVALPLQLFGRTGGALCRPDSILQAHALWHVATAFAIACACAVVSRAGHGRRADQSNAPAR